MNDEELVRCPFNASHLILKPRLAAHLVKCSKQYNLGQYSICPFNSTHHVPTETLQTHCETCEDRKNLESHLYVVGDEPKPEDDSCYKLELPSSHENWDEDSPTTGSYLDVKNEAVANQPVFRIPVGLSKAKRKEFIKNEVQRFEGITNAQNKASHGNLSTTWDTWNTEKRGLRDGPNKSGVKDDVAPDDGTAYMMRSKGRGRGSLGDLLGIKK